MKQRKASIKPYVGAAAVLLAASLQQNALALPPIKIGDVDVGTISGYARVHGQWNLKDHPEINAATGTPFNGKNDLSMLRESVEMQYISGKLLPYDMQLTVVGRLSKESRTDYLKKLDASSRAFSGGLSGGLMDNYNSNNEAIREAYLDIPFSDRVRLRFGKQQVVWGETDLLQALDLVNPRDLSWRALFEPEDESWRKPLIMANLMIDVPAARGGLQLLYRPGWDRETQMGNTLDLFGGRWAPQGLPPATKGFPTLTFIPYNYHHPHGDTDDASYGARWTGVAGDLGYSLAYYHTLSDNPVLNVSVPAFFPGDTAITPYKGSIGPGGLFGPVEFILPEIDIIGGSMNYPLTGIDMVLRGELAATLDKPYNAVSGSITGLPTIKEETTVKFMIGFDKPWRGGKDIFGTTGSPFWTVQIFDSWIPGFDKKDQLLDIGASKLKEHSVVAVTTFNLSYNNDTVNPGIALAIDTSNGGGLVLPSVNILYGDHWRLRLDAAFFFLAQGGCSTNPVTGAGANCTHLFGTFDNNDMVSARLTYQF